MKSIPYKAFHAYLVTGTIATPIAELDKYRVQEPSGGSWGAIGLAEAIEGEGLWVKLEVGGRLACVQFNERILPGPVRDEKLKLAVEKAKAATSEGKITKKEYAQLRDEVEFELLPKAFIRRTKVPVIVYRYSVMVNGEVSNQQVMLVFTSSPKRASDAALVMMNAFPGVTARGFGMCAGMFVDKLTAAAKDGQLDHDQEDNFFVTDAAVLKGDKKKTIRIKDKDIQDGDILKLLDNSYDVHELGFTYTPAGHDDYTMEFSFTDKFVVKGMKFPGIKATKDNPLDFYATTILALQTIRQMLRGLVYALGGLKYTDDVPDDEDF